MESNKICKIFEYFKIRDEHEIVWNFDLLIRGISVHLSIRQLEPFESRRTLILDMPVAMDGFVTKNPEREYQNKSNHLSGMDTSTS